MKTLAWPMEADEIHAIDQTLRFEHCMWDIYHRGQRNLLPDAIVLSRAEHELLTRTATDTWRSLREVESAVARNPEALEAIGIPENLQSLVSAEQPGAPRLTRCDFHLTVGGRWVISEFNEDGPGGFAESHGLNVVLAGQWSDRFPGLSFEGEIRRALIEALAPWQNIGLVYATGYSIDLQQTALIADWLRQAGHQVVMGSPANLSMSGAQARLFDTQIEALFRYFPGEWIGDLPNFDHWQQATGRLPMMNSLSALIAQSKRFYAATDAHELDLSESARQCIDQHLPTSHYLSAELRERLLQEREAWVLKGAFGRMGDTVRLGIGSSPEQWQEAIDRALGNADQFAIQERFDAVPMWFSNGMGYATIGLYLVDGQFAGYYSRVSPYPVINFDACHVATLVETA
jgi:hypothetical protein